MVVDSLPQVKQAGYDIEIIDVRTVNPIDYGILEESAKKLERY